MPPQLAPLATCAAAAGASGALPEDALQAELAAALALLGLPALADCHAAVVSLRADPRWRQLAALAAAAKASQQGCSQLLPGGLGALAALPLLAAALPGAGPDALLLLAEAAQAGGV